MTTRADDVAPDTLSRSRGVKAAALFRFIVYIRHEVDDLKDPLLSYVVDIAAQSLANIASEEGVDASQFISSDLMRCNA